MYYFHVKSACGVVLPQRKILYVVSEGLALLIGLPPIVDIFGFDLKSPKRIRCLSVIGTSDAVAATTLNYIFG